MPDVILPQNDPQVEALLRESEAVRRNFRKLQEDFDEINELLNRCKRMVDADSEVEVRIKVRPIAE